MFMGSLSRDFFIPFANYAQSPSSGIIPFQMGVPTSYWYNNPAIFPTNMGVQSPTTTSQPMATSSGTSSIGGTSTPSLGGTSGLGISASPLLTGGGLIQGNMGLNSLVQSNLPFYGQG
jgi:hypothetical protein